MSRPKPSGRSYGRLTRHERNTVERMLDRNRSAREIAAELGRSPSTVTREVAAHRYVTAPRSRYGEPAPADLSGACPRLSAWPRCCNGCSHRRGYGCSRRPRVFYSARRAQEAADAELSASRSGIDETEEGAAAKLAAIRDGLARGLSPQQIAATTPGLSASTVYRWVVLASIYFSPFSPTYFRQSRQRGCAGFANADAPLSASRLPPPSRPRRRWIRPSGGTTVPLS